MTTPLAVCIQYSLRVCYI